jgi:hypothetical protein
MMHVLVYKLAVLTCVFLSSCSYDDLVGILNMERQLCDRKLDQLTSKRRDEEDRRAILSKRVARAKVRFNRYTL